MRKVNENFLIPFWAEVTASNLSYSDNLLNKHLPLLMTLCVISVPGTGEMLEIQIKKAWPSSLWNSQTKVGIDM